MHSNAHPHTHIHIYKYMHIYTHSYLHIYTYICMMPDADLLMHKTLQMECELYSGNLI